MPLYNVEEYFEEAIYSMIKQTIGFKESIQVILVNDGSPDNIEEKCLAYKKKYPENIIYVKKENGGVSSARNEGMKHIRGKYTLFFDADDKWDKNSFKRIFDFFEKHYSEIDVCTCRMKYIGLFEKKIHPLDYKYKNGSRVVNLIYDSKMINSTIGNAVFKSETVKNFDFNEKLISAEDALFLNSILLEKNTCGLISSAIYYYRRQVLNLSASSAAPQKKTWYFDVPQYYYFELFRLCKKKYQYVPQYIQRIVMYDIQWRRKYRNVMSTFSEEEMGSYRKAIKDVLGYIDDEIILESKSISKKYIVFFLSLKHEKNIKKDFDLNENKVYSYKGIRIAGIQDQSRMVIKIISVNDNKLEIDGTTDIPYWFEGNKIYAKTGEGKIFPAQIYRYNVNDSIAFTGEIISEGKRFHISMPLKEIKNIGFYSEKTDGEMCQLNPRIDEVARRSRKYRFSFFEEGGYIFLLRKKLICIYQNRYSIRTFLKKIYKWEMLKNKNYDDYLEWKIFYDKKHLIKNKVSFISFRTNGKLKGNMEALQNSFKKTEISFFAGMPPHTNGEKQKITKIIRSSKVIVVDDYNYILKYSKLKEKQKIVQVWHACGAFKSFGKDGTSLLPSVDSDFHKKYSMVAVTSEYVREIYAKAFGLDVSKVQALGSPRTDKLFDQGYLHRMKKNAIDRYPLLKNKEVILYAPTFRDHKGSDKTRFVPRLNFRKISTILRDNQILVICPHPVMKNDILSEKYNNIIEIRDITTIELMPVSDLLITDYSSVIFEYSLLNKPMAFYCYDLEIYNRDFYIKYPDDLPGPVFKEEKDLLDYITEKSHNIDSKRYEKFIKKYMSACDGHSCERIMKIINQFLDS